MVKGQEISLITGKPPPCQGVPQQQVGRQVGTQVGFFTFDPDSACAVDRQAPIFLARRGKDLIVDSGVNTLAKYAFSSSYVPGQPDLLYGP